jgi:hypothetical protein
MANNKPNGKNARKSDDKRPNGPVVPEPSPRLAIWIAGVFLIAIAAILVYDAATGDPRLSWSTEAEAPWSRAALRNEHIRKKRKAPTPFGGRCLPRKRKSRTTLLPLAD